ncbi:MAG: hydroxyethylthiazole kinase [Brevinema sp.]
MIDIKKLKQKIEQQNPLILNLTNTVVMNSTANALLALGASPIMSADQKDSLELLSLADAVSINIGTLDDDFINRSLSVAKENNKKKPLILDPAGAGASQIRTQTAQSLIPYSSVLRCNSGEIFALQGKDSLMKGVDTKISIDSNDTSMISKIIDFSQKNMLIAGISGKNDLITDGTQYINLGFGDELMSKITGMGCILSALTATFCAIEDDWFNAVVASFVFYSLCGELAVQKTRSLGFFESYFIETLANPNYEYIEEKINALKIKKFR